MRDIRRRLVTLAVILTLLIPTAAATAEEAGDGGETAEITLLHTNDFHGRLESDYKGRGGSANMAGVIGSIRDEVGPDNVVLMDAGDAYFAAPAISQLLMGESTIDIYNRMGYDLAAFGNHEFDKGQTELAARVAQSTFPWLGANVVIEGTAWDLPEWAQAYELVEVGGITLGVLGLAGQETPQVTLLGTTAGLEFKDLTATILHYMPEIMAQADALAVIVHMGTSDSGPYKGLATVAQELIDAGSPVDLMIGGHQHQALYEPLYVGDTAIVSAGYYGRWLGRVDVTIDPATKALTVDAYELLTINDPGVKTAEMATAIEEAFEAGLIRKGAYKSLMKKLSRVDAKIAKGAWKAAANQMGALISQVEALSGKRIDPVVAEELISAGEWFLYALPDKGIARRVAFWAEVVAPIVNQPVGATTIDLVRDYNDESVMGDLVTDSMLWKADWYDDGVLNGSVDVAFTNPGGLRADILIPDGATLPYTITWGQTFDVLPFGNTLYLMDLTGAQIQVLLDQSANLYKGILQTSGAEWSWYNDTGDDEPTVWGAYYIEIGGLPLDPGAVYRVVTNNFLAGGQDGWTTFGEGTNRWDTYYDMQAGFVEYIGSLPDGVIDADDVPMDRITRLDTMP